MREIDKIIIHCTATRPDFMKGHSFSEKVAEIKRWHVKDRKWSDIGYHYLVGRSGEVATGRAVERTGAHVRGHNTGSIGVSLFGGHGSSENDLIEDNYTPDQIMALRRLLKRLNKQYPKATFHGHNEFAAKACPGFRVTDDLVQELLAHVEPATPPSPANPVRGNFIADFLLFLASLFQRKPS